MRYFFDIQDHAGETRDTWGAAFINFDAMRLVARRTLARITEEQSALPGPMTLSMRVRNEQGAEVYQLSLFLVEKR